MAHNWKKQGIEHSSNINANADLIVVFVFVDVKSYKECYHQKDQWLFEAVIKGQRSFETISDDKYTAKKYTFPFPKRVSFFLTITSTMGTLC